MSEFLELGLGQPLAQALRDAGYKTPTPIQAQAIGPILLGRDVLGIAQTGTGKTAAFALPILERLAAEAGRPEPSHCRVLVLCPTRELAAQIETSFKRYGRHMNLSIAAIYGGVGFDKQIRALRHGLDVLIATPGRLMDLMQQRHAKLAHVSTLVLDEADRMLDMGFIAPIRKIVADLPLRRQTLLFSATMPGPIATLSAELLHDPVRVEVSPQSTTVERITQSVIMIEKSRKRDLLIKLLEGQGIYQALVFTRTKHGADRVSEGLERLQISAAAIHGNKSQSQRERALRAFRSGSLRVMVATDIAARGLDIPGVSHVINFDLPVEPEAYVHRIGRTARAGRDGQAISFCSSDERGTLRDIERLIKQSISINPSPLGAHAPAPQAGHSQVLPAMHVPHNSELREQRAGHDGPRQERGPRRDFRGGSGPRRDSRASGPRRDDRGSGPRRDERGSGPRRDDNARPARFDRERRPSSSGASSGSGSARPWQRDNDRGPRSEGRGDSRGPGSARRDERGPSTSRPDSGKDRNYPTRSSDVRSSSNSSSSAGGEGRPRRSSGRSNYRGNRPRQGSSGSGSSGPGFIGKIKKFFS